MCLHQQSGYVIAGSFFVHYIMIKLLKKCFTIIGLIFNHKMRKSLQKLTVQKNLSDYIGTDTFFISFCF